MASAGCSFVPRSMMVGTTYTAVSVVTAAIHARVYSCDHSSDGSGLNGFVEKETGNEKRSLRDAQHGVSRDLAGAALQGRHRWWHSVQDTIDHSHESTHTRNRHDHYNDHDRESDDEYNSRDDNNDDVKDDDDEDDDDGGGDEKDNEDEDDSRNDSGHSSQSASGGDPNVGSINIGNTITIINISNANQQPGNIGPSISEPNGNVLADQAAIPSAAARAFCDIVGCNFSQGSPSTDTNSSSLILPTTPSVADSNATRDKDVRCEMPVISVISNSSSRVPKRIATWLLLVALLIELCC